MARRWSEVVEHPACQSGEREFEIALERGALRFVAARDGRGEGLSAFAVAVADREQLLDTARARGALDPEGRVRVGGTRIDLR